MKAKSPALRGFFYARPARAAPGIAGVIEGGEG